MACSGPAAPARRSKSDIRTTSTPTCADDEGQHTRVVARGGVCSARKAAAAPALATPPDEPGGSGSALLSSGRGEGSTSHVPPAKRLGTVLRKSWRDGRRPQRGEFGRACLPPPRVSHLAISDTLPAWRLLGRRRIPALRRKQGAHKRRPRARMSPEARMRPRRSRTCPQVNGRFAAWPPSSTPRLRGGAASCTNLTTMAVAGSELQSAARAGIAEARRDQDLTSGADD
jgi:hypothetical protein